MKRVEFRLSIPNVGSWNNKWSGKDRNYSIVRKVSDSRADKLLSGRVFASWFHHWGDGWSARVSARVVPVGERLKKSDGFCGYDWMVTNILAYGDTDPNEREALETKHEQVWNTKELHEDFKVISFLAPFISVVKITTGEKGTMSFQAIPRYYFDFVPSRG